MPLLSRAYTALGLCVQLLCDIALTADAAGGEVGSSLSCSLSLDLNIVWRRMEWNRK